MGCNQTASSAKDPLKIYKTSFGVVTITLQNLHVYSVENKADKNYNQFFAKFTMSNQEAISKNIVQSGFKDIEARHLSEGRSLSIQLYERGSIITESFVGFTILDLDFLLKEKYMQSMKVYLNNHNEKVGWAEIKAQFQDFDTKVITLMFDTVIIRRKNGFGAMYCKVKAQIGEQVMYTSTSQDKKDHPACWKGEMLTFYYLKDYHREGKITVYDQEEIIGSMIINLQEFQQATELQIQIKEQFHNQGQIAGSLKFIVAKGQKIQQTHFMARSAIVSSSKKRKNSPERSRVQRSRIQRSSKFKETVNQEHQNYSEAHPVELNQKNHEKIVEIKKQEPKIQFIRQNQNNKTPRQDPIQTKKIEIQSKKIVIQNKNVQGQIKNPQDLSKSPSHSIGSNDVFKKPENLGQKTEDISKKANQQKKKQEPIKKPVSPKKTQDLPKKPEQIIKKPEESAKKTQDLPKKTEETAKKPEESAKKAQDLPKKTEETAKKPEELAKRPLQNQKSQHLIKNPSNSIKIPQDLLKKPQQQKKETKQTNVIQKEVSANVKMNNNSNSDKKVQQAALSSQQNTSITTKPIENKPLIEEQKLKTETPPKETENSLVFEDQPHSKTPQKIQKDEKQVIIKQIQSQLVQVNQASKVSNNVPVNPQPTNSKKLEASSPPALDRTLVGQAALSAQQSKIKEVIQNVPVLKTQ